MSVLGQLLYGLLPLFAANQKWIMIIARVVTGFGTGKPSPRSPLSSRFYFRPPGIHGHRCRPPRPSPGDQFRHRRLCLGPLVRPRHPGSVFIYQAVRLLPGSVHPSDHRLDSRSSRPEHVHPPGFSNGLHHRPLLSGRVVLPRGDVFRGDRQEGPGG